MHVAAEELIIALQALHKAPRRDDASFLLLRVDLHQYTASVTYAMIASTLSGDNKGLLFYVLICKGREFYGLCRTH